jgi:hypothetical protein
MNTIINYKKKNKCYYLNTCNSKIIKHLCEEYPNCGSEKCKPLINNKIKNFIYNIILKVIFTKMFINIKNFTNTKAHRSFYNSYIFTFVNGYAKIEGERMHFDLYDNSFLKNIKLTYSNLKKLFKKYENYEKELMIFPKYEDSLLSCMIIIYMIKEEREKSIELKEFQYIER